MSDSLTVAAVAQVVGVAPSTLRTWARRYGLEPSGHRSGLHRRYAESDVARLQFMRMLTQTGLSSKQAAARALDATEEQLVSATLAHPLHDASSSTAGGSARPLAAGAEDPALTVIPLRPGVDRVPLAGAPGLPRPTYPPRPRPGGEVSAAVGTLVRTIGNGDAQGSTALLRLAVRDIGAARTWDEHVLAARTVLWGLPDSQRPRALGLLDHAVGAAVGELRNRRAPRNPVPVHLACLPGHLDHAALRLLEAALCERSIESRSLPTEATVAAAVGTFSALGSGVLAVFVAEGPLPSQLAPRVRQAVVGVDQVYWGEGWVHWPGQEATLTDVVRAVESRAVPGEG